MAPLLDRVEVDDGALRAYLVAWSGGGWTMCSALVLVGSSQAGFFLHVPGGEETWTDLVLSEVLVGYASCGGRLVG
jgi:uncharacterized membrane protein YbhN (UPF0104 family)